MKTSKNFLSLLLAAIMVFTLIPSTSLAANFPRVNITENELFSDVTSGDWFFTNVKDSFELGLMKGQADGTFNPSGNVTLAEAITISARIHAIAANGKEDFVQGNPWYQVYVDYALENGIITTKPDDFNRAATRLEFADILSHALPDNMLTEINTIPLGAIPDVASDAAIYKLYRAGVLTGNDEKGTFLPESNIKRCEVSAIATRMALPETRIKNDLKLSTDDDKASTTGNKNVISAIGGGGGSSSRPKPEKPQEPEKIEVSADVEVDENGAVKNEISMDGENVGATVPAGVAVSEGADKLTLTVAPMKETGGNIETGENDELKSLDVHIKGVSEDNTVAILVTLGEILPIGMNLGNITLYHIENDETNAMTQVDSLEELDAHNEFYYDPATGIVTVAMATFSEIAIVSDTTAAWEGKFDYNWYDASKTELTIANADQLAAFGAIVGGMNGQGQDSFTDKTVKLIADINLGDKESENNSDLIFYPIGYYNSDGTYEKTNTAITSGFKTFEGTFDGNGHTIANFYQNTWEMKGDHNWYDATLQYYRDGMGLFGKVYGGTVKNLTVKNFSSDGEITTTGVIASYADCGATFENISIFNCNPRVYNIGNGGIVGCVGWYANDSHDTAVTFKNITVDNTNKISALWGSYDVACGGLVGQYYPTSGQTDPIDNAGIYMENCHVAAQMDVYNDVCANYQYYAYRYAGILIGSVRENKTENGYVYPNMDGITASGCTVHYGDWNDYYYCELVANSLASYTHDHQMSRLEQVASVDVANMKVVTLKGEEKAISTEGRYNYVVVKAKGDDGKWVHGDGHDYAECYHFVNGVQHKHDVADPDNPEIYEIVNDVQVLKEDKQLVYREFNNLVTGYGWGVTSKGVGDMDGVTILDREEGNSLVKFETKFTGDFLYRVGNQNAVSVGDLFKAIDGVTINKSGVYVTIDAVDEDIDVSGTFTANTSAWTEGTIKFTGTGPVKVTIQDYDYCIPTVLYLEVVEATNVTSAEDGTGMNFVLLDDVTFSDTYLYYKNSTLYGNGFEIDITGADHNDLKDASDTSSNKFAYCNIWMVDSRFDNVKIIGSVYPKVGMTADSDYGNAAIRTEGECHITNSYISNTRVPLRIQGNTYLENTIVYGGRYANIEVRSGKVTLDGVTTINTVRKGSDGTTDVIGFGIVIHDEATNTSISVVGEDGLKQYNWVGENKHKTILSGDTYLSNAYKLIFNANNSDSIYFDYDNDRYVNTGILCLCADINKDVVTGLDDRYCQEVSGYDAWVLTYDNSKHTEWFNESILVETVELAPKQNPVIPSYSGSEAQTVEFTKGETYYFDTSVLTAEKFGQSLTISSVVLNGTTYNYGDKIPITEGGVYEVTYTVVDPYNYDETATPIDPINHTVSIMVTAIAKDAEILAPKFTFIDQNGNKYESTTVKAGDKTYVMPNVTAADPTTNSMNSINIGSASISGTTVYFPVATGYTVRNGSNFNRYYPLFNGINITDYTIAGDTTGTTYTTSGNYTSLVGSSGTKFIIPANGGQTNCGDYVKTDGQAGNAAGNSDSGWQGAGYNTSYGGTYLKSGNTNASSGADSNGYERIVWVEYSFNAGNGDVYYYRIGYHCNKESAQSCFTPDTLITLADGTRKRIDEVSFGDKILAWDFFNGEYTEQDISLLVNHGENLYQVVNSEFSDGTVLRTIADHGIFDYDLNKFIYITAENAADYIGHRFVKANSNGSYDIVTLEDAYVTEEYTNAYSITSAFSSNAFAEGMLTVAPPDDFYNWIEMGDTLIYDVDAFNADIEKYGLYTYDDFADYVTYDQFIAFNGAYLKIPVEKGIFTFDYILELIELYVSYMPQ